MHNNYLTLPVLFTMLVGHFAFVFGHEDAWLALVLDRRAARRRAALLQPLAHGAAGVVDPRRRPRSARSALAFWLEPEEAPSSTAGPVSFAQVAADRRASAARPATRARRRRSASGSRRRAEIEARAEDIERQAVLTRAMPPGQRDRDDRGGARAPRRLGRRSR